MKNTIKIPFKPLTGHNCEQAEAQNVRLDDGNMSVVGTPRAVCAKTAVDKFLGIDTRGDTTYYFMQRNGRTVLVAGYSRSGTSTAAEKEIFDAGSEVTAIASSGDFVVLTTASGLKYLRFVGNGYSLVGGMVEAPSFCFGTTLASSASTDIPGLTLKSTYRQWRGSLTASDKTTAKSNFVAAIAELQRMATLGGYCLQPIVLRVAVRLWDDTLVWSDEAVCVGSGWTPEAVATVNIGDETTVEQTTLSAEMWQPTVCIVANGIGEWAPLVKAVEIYATDEPQDFTTMRFRCEQTQTGSKAYSLRMRAENDAEALVSDAAEAQTLRLVATITDIDSLASGTLRGSGIADLGNGVYAISMVRSRQAAWSNAPRRFTAATFCAIGSNIFAGDVTSFLPSAPHYLSLVDGAQLTAGMASAYVSVDIATDAGKATVTRAELVERYSLQTANMLTYPDSRARTMTIIAVAGGTRYSLTVDLLPSACGNYAYASKAGGFTLTPSSSTTIPSSVLTSSRSASLLLMCDGGNPLQWSQCKRADNTGVVGVMPSLRYGTTWSVGRSPVCLFSTDGLRLLSFNTSGECTASTRISQCTIANAMLVAATERGVAFVDTHGEVCRYEGSKVQALGIDASWAKGMVYSTVFDEVIVYGSDCAIAVAADGTYTTRTLAFTTHSHNLPADDSCVYSTDAEDARTMAVSLLTPPIAVEARQRLVQWFVSADTADVVATVYGENGFSCHGIMLCRMRLCGRLSAPVRQRIASPRVRTLRLALSGNLPTSAKVYEAVILSQQTNRQV